MQDFHGTSFDVQIFHMPVPSLLTEEPQHLVTWVDLTSLIFLFKWGMKDSCSDYTRRDKDGIIHNSERLMSNIYPGSPPRPNSTLFLKRPIILVRIYNQTIPGDYYLTSRIYLVINKNIILFLNFG